MCNTHNYFKRITIIFVVIATTLIGFLLITDNVSADGPTGTLVDTSYNVDKGATNERGYHYWPGVFRARFSGTDIGVYCIDAETLTYNGTAYNESSRAIDCRVQWLVINYPPSLTGLSTPEAAARQAAIWHFTNGGLYVTNRPNVQRRAWDIINSIPADPCNNLPKPPTIEFIQPEPNSVNPIDVPFDLVILVKDQAGNPLAGQTITLQATGGTLSNKTISTGADGKAQVSIVADSMQQATVTAALSYEYLKAIPLEATVQPRQNLIRVKPHRERVSTNITVEWKQTSTSDLIIIKMANMNGTYQFTSDQLGSFKLTNGGKVTFNDLTPGSYSFAENPASFPMPHMSLIKVSCVDNDNHPLATSINYDEFRADIELPPSQTVTCTVLNEAPGNESGNHKLYLPIVVQ